MYNKLLKKGLFVLTLTGFAIANHLSNFTLDQQHTYAKTLHSSMNTSRSIANIAVDRKSDEKEKAKVREARLQEILKVLTINEEDSSKISKHVNTSVNLSELKKIQDHIELPNTLSDSIRAKVLTEIETKMQALREEARQAQVQCLRGQISNQKAELEKQIADKADVVEKLEEKLNKIEKIVNADKKEKAKANEKKTDDPEINKDLMAKIFQSILTGQGFMNNPFSYFSQQFARNTSQYRQDSLYSGFFNRAPFNHDYLNQGQVGHTVYERAINYNGYFKNRQRNFGLDDNIYSSFERRTERDYFLRDDISSNRSPSSDFFRPTIKSHTRENISDAVYFDFSQT